MNFLLWLLVVTYLCLLEVKCRSVQLDSDIHYVHSDGAGKEVNHDPESNGRFSWKRLKPILRWEVQRITNVKGDTSENNEETKETASSIPPKMNSEIVNVDKKEESSLKAGSQVTNISSVKPELHKYMQDEVQISESNVTEEFFPNLTQFRMLQLDSPLITNDFPDSIISNILNKSSDSILLQVFNDNSSDIDSLEFDETSLLSEGGHVATLQEVSTVGFELLIDSETKKNLILAELLSSQANLIDDDDDDFDNSTDEDDLSFVTILLNHSNGSETQEIAIVGEPTDNPDVIEFDEDEVETEDSEFHLDFDEVRTENTDDKDGTEVSEFNIDDATENVEFGTGVIKIEDTESSSTGEIKNESELSNSVQDDSVTENKTEIEEPKCPDPGWCIFWFLALDTCAKDSHCHGSLLCCMIGCSKTCIDPVTEF